jgi:hypothetical protein
MVDADAARIVELLRWLAVELEAGRATVNLTITPDVEVVAQPRSRHDAGKPRALATVEHGARWEFNGTTLEMPP